LKKLVQILPLLIVFISCGPVNKNNTNDQKIKSASSAFKILNKINIGGDGGWDYAAFDTIHRRLYLSHSIKTDIVDIDKEQVIGAISNTSGVHGIAFAYSLDKGFTSNGKDSSVTIFDLNTMKFITKIKINGANPDAIIFDPFSLNIFTFNGKSHNSTAIEAETGKIAGTVELDGKPEFSVSDGKGKVFVNIEDKNEIQVINSKTLKVDFTWKLDSGDEPSGLAFDSKFNRLFIACNNKILEVKNADNGKTVAIRNIGKGVDAAAFNPVSREIFTSNGEGNLTVIQQTDADHYGSPENIPTQKGARTMAIDIQKDRIYLPVADFGPPAPAEQGKKSRPSVIPGSFSVLIVGK
jgi:WD40 repeat protein